MERIMPTKKEFKVQKLAALKGKNQPGAAKSIGAVWVTIARSSRRAVAERVMKHAQIDNPDNQIRIEEVNGA